MFPCISLTLPRIPQNGNPVKFFPPILTRCISFCRESFGNGGSTQAGSRAETLRDYRAAAACRARLETNQPAQTSGDQ